MVLPRVFSLSGRRGAIASLLGGIATTTLPAHAQESTGLSHYGLPGYVEMPSAYALPDGALAFSINDHGGDVRRGTIAFQITPRLTGTFRYSWFKDYSATEGSRYDRSFDLRYQLLTEDPQGWRPALAIGLQDFGGTGLFEGEYLVASKRFSPSVTASVGIGWGRLGSYGEFSNPLGVFSDRFKTRLGRDGSPGGDLNVDHFFRGDAALFFGLDWQATERLRLSVEYSSDGMDLESSRMGFDHKTPINIGAQYRFGEAGTLGLALLNGSAAALSYSFILDPREPVAPSGAEAGPPPVAPGGAAAAASWGPVPDEARVAALRAGLKDQGIRLDGIRVEGAAATVSVSNERWPAAAEAYGRTARVLSAHLPAQVRSFRIVSHVKGVPVTSVTLTRADLEALEYATDGARLSRERAVVRDAAGLPDPRLNPDRSFDVKLRPYVTPAFFDPDAPLRLDAGAEARAEWSPVRGLYLSGAVRGKVVGNTDASSRDSNSGLPHVRSDGPLYDRESSDLYIPYVTAEWFARPGTDLYSRVSFGLLERMYGGVSGEVLWAPADRRYAVGAELNYVKQRDYEGEFGFLDYDVVTGHVSGYYDIGGGYNAQVDIGRYLAGDWGSTFTLTRRFGNGFEVGAFFTLTDVSFEDFGEGSFDKGVTFRIPLTWLTGQPSQESGGLTLRPIQRDGGARLSVRNRLYDLTRSEREPELTDQWGSFWR